jgi:hypothetical protein
MGNTIIAGVLKRNVGHYDGREIYEERMTYLQ